MNIGERFANSEPHDQRSVALYKFIADLDYRELGDSFCFKSGGDGDNGENIMYLLDCYFEHCDAEREVDV